MAAAYLPPNHSMNEEKISALIDFVANICTTLGPRDRFMLIGDFNQSTLSWTSASEENGAAFDFYEPHAHSARSVQFVDGLHQNGLYQLNFNTNSSGRILDLIYANWPAASTCSSIRVYEYPLTTIDEHHPPLDFYLDNVVPVTIATAIDADKRLNYARVAFPKLERLILSFGNSFNCSDYSTIDDVTEAFYEFI